MNQFVLVCNCGSSSIKFCVFDQQTDVKWLSGQVDNIDGAAAQCRWQAQGRQGSDPIEHNDYDTALQSVIDLVHQQMGADAHIAVIGHRIVHGGKVLTDPVLIKDETLRAIKDCIPLAPLHNPAHVLGIEKLRALFPGTPQVAVFDTGFHKTLPDVAYTYALPYELSEQHDIRRYGFHGISYAFLTQTVSALLETPPQQLNAIMAHLGNGASVCAVKNGQSVDVSMGMTPLEGLVMGTRCGDIDVGIVPYLAKRLSLGLPEIMNLLQKASGLLGVSGQSFDMRDLEKASDQGDRRATLAIELFCYRVAKTIAAYQVPLGRLDSIVFSGGIGEHSTLVRAKIVDQLSFMGCQLDIEANKMHGRGAKGDISQGRLPVMVVKTNEELMIARYAVLVCEQESLT